MIQVISWLIALLFAAAILVVPIYAVVYVIGG